MSRARRRRVRTPLGAARRRTRPAVGPGGHRTVILSAFDQAITTLPAAGRAGTPAAGHQPCSPSDGSLGAATVRGAARSLAEAEEAIDRLWCSNAVPA